MKRIVVKLGTSTLTGGAKQLAHPRMVDLVRQFANVRSMNCELVVVELAWRKKPADHIDEMAHHQTSCARTWSAKASSYFCGWGAEQLCSGTTPSARGRSRGWGDKLTRGRSLLDGACFEAHAAQQG